MKSICLLTIFFAGSFAYCQIHNEVYKGKYFNKIDEGLFTEYQLRKQVKDGKWLFYEKDSILRLEVNFFNGKKNGTEIEYYPNGKLKSHKNYVEGVIHGSATKYHDDGYILSQLIYNQGKLHGTQKLYHPRGLNHHETIDYVEGKRHGKSIEYLHDSTWKRSETTWLNGKRNGEYKEWHFNGQLSVHGAYFPNTNYDHLYSYNNRDGDWTYWNEKGEIIKVEHWEKENLLSISEYISDNHFKRPTSDIQLITKECLGAYCLGKNIHTYNVRRGGTTQQGDSLYYSYYGDSLDQIWLQPIFSDTNHIYLMHTFSPRFRTQKNIGVGSTVKEIIESGEQITVMHSTGDRNPLILLIDYGISMHLDKETNLLFRYRKDTPKLNNLRLDGYVTSIEMKK